MLSECDGNHDNQPPTVVAPVDGLALIAYRVNKRLSMRLAPAPASRSWMAVTCERFANRCLPLLIANQSGWFVLNSHVLRAVWSGADDLSSLKIEYLGGPPPYPAISHFGHGILTWTLPYLFRTPPGYNLLVRGPANWPKDGAHPLEGSVESDWSPATFTMNWKLTRADHQVAWEVGEPICMIVPQRRRELEAFRPQVRDIDSYPTIKNNYEKWSESREKFLADLEVPESEAVKQKWQKDYFRGILPDGLNPPEHQTKLKLRDFDEPD